jgi:hypothetical protein
MGIELTGGDVTVTMIALSQMAIAAEDTAADLTEAGDHEGADQWVQYAIRAKAVHHKLASGVDQSEESSIVMPS